MYVSRRMGPEPRVDSSRVEPIQFKSNQFIKELPSLQGGMDRWSCVCVY